MDKTPNGWLGSFLGIAGFAMTCASFAAAYASNPDSPYFTTTLTAVAVVGAFMLGFNARGPGSDLATDDDVAERFRMMGEEMGGKGR